MPPPPPVEAGRTPPALAALAGSGEDVPALAADIEAAAAITAIIYTNNAPETVRRWRRSWRVGPTSNHLQPAPSSTWWPANFAAGWSSTRTWTWRRP